jgi:hypothetical protein
MKYTLRRFWASAYQILVLLSCVIGYCLLMYGLYRAVYP